MKIASRNPASACHPRRAFRALGHSVDWFFRFRIGQINSCIVLLIYLPRFRDEFSGYGDYPGLASTSKANLMGMCGFVGTDAAVLRIVRVQSRQSSEKKLIWTPRWFLRGNCSPDLPILHGFKAEASVWQSRAELIRCASTGESPAEAKKNDTDKESNQLNPAVGNSFRSHLIVLCVPGKPKC